MALFAITASAQSNTDRYHVTFMGDPTITAVSGSRGTSSTVLERDNPNSILYSLGLAERRDSPCQVFASFWSANGGFSDQPDSGNFVDESRTNCFGFAGGLPRSRRDATAQFPLGSFRGENGAAAIHGIQVCTNDRNANNLKVKGIKVLVSRLNEDGQGSIVRSGSYAQRFERRHCRKWEQVRRCPVGQVAVGVEIFRRGSSVTGLALQCRAVTIVLM